MQQIPADANRAEGPTLLFGDDLRNRVVGRNAHVHDHIDRGNDHEQRHHRYEQRNAARHGQAVQRRNEGQQERKEIRKIADKAHVGNRAHADAARVKPDDNRKEHEVNHQLRRPEGDADPIRNAEIERRAGIRTELNLPKHRHTKAHQQH